MDPKKAHALGAAGGKERPAKVAATSPGRGPER
jgi:hypothetical protein